MIKVLLVDDHEAIRAGLKNYIKDIVPSAGIEEANDGDAAVKMIKINNYALIILDINIPATDSFGLFKKILLAKPGSRILIFSVNAEEIFATKYLKLGALGYLNKAATPEEIVSAITNVLENKRYLSPSLTEILTVSALGLETNTINPFTLLSTRELEITKQLIKGESVSQIGSLLNMHASTVGSHKARIFGKLGCKNIVSVNKLATAHNFSLFD